MTFEKLVISLLLIIFNRLIFKDKIGKEQKKAEVDIIKSVKAFLEAGQ